VFYHFHDNDEIILKLARTFKTSLRKFSKIIADFWIFLKLLRTAHVIIPMVLQIGETVLLQSVELVEKASSSYFWDFERVAVSMGEAWVCRKTSFKVEIVTDEAGAFQKFMMRIQRSIKIAQFP